MITSTERVYYANTYLDKLKVKVLAVGQDENGSYVICDQTLFHPKGGGQPSDEGYLVKGDKRYTVKKLVISDNPSESVVQHYYEGEGEFLKGEEVNQVIDLQKRLLAARYHSAGHLLSLAVNQLYPKLDGYKGNHFPGQAFVVFEGHLPTDFSVLKEKVTNLVNQLVRNNHLI
jgi:alanyl-tRNA synthetase